MEALLNNEKEDFWRRRAVDEFRSTDIPHRLLHSIQNSLWRYTYRGVLMQKSPFDLALYTKLLWDSKPRTVIEIGTQHGGSALWFADQLKALGLDGHVHSVDITPPLGLSHPGVTFHQADARQIGLLFSREVVASLPRPLLVVEDSDHQ